MEQKKKEIKRKYKQLQLYYLSCLCGLGIGVGSSFYVSRLGFKALKMDPFVLETEVETQYDKYTFNNSIFKIDGFKIKSDNDSNLLITTPWIKIGNILQQDTYQLNINFTQEEIEQLINLVAEDKIELALDMFQWKLIDSKQIDELLYEDNQYYITGTAYNYKDVTREVKNRSIVAHMGIISGWLAYSLLLSFVYLVLWVDMNDILDKKIEIPLKNFLDKLSDEEKSIFILEQSITEEETRLKMMKFLLTEKKKLEKQIEIKEWKILITKLNAVISENKFGDIGNYNFDMTNLKKNFPELAYAIDADYDYLEEEKPALEEHKLIRKMEEESNTRYEK